jgi:hypothetical protein
MLPTSRSVIVYSVLSTLLLGVALAILLSSEDVPTLAPIEGPRTGAVQLQPQEPQRPDRPVTPPDGDGSGTAPSPEPGPAPQSEPGPSAPTTPTTPTDDQYGDTVSLILANVGQP